MKVTLTTATNLEALSITIGRAPSLKLAAMGVGNAAELLLNKYSSGLRRGQPRGDARSPRKIFAKIPISDQSLALSPVAVKVTLTTATNLEALSITIGRAPSLKLAPMVVGNAAELIKQTFFGAAAGTAEGCLLAAQENISIFFLRALDMFFECDFSRSAWTHAAPL